jgi:replication factor C subunit 3/5
MTTTTTDASTTFTASLRNSPDLRSTSLNEFSSNSQEITDFIPWVEKYRPSQFQDIVLDPLNREIFHNILNKNYFPHLLFYGPPGTGKTTTIINLINEFQSKYHRINKSNVIHLNASDERGIDIIRNQIHQFAKSMNLFEQGIKIVILDEVDYMTKNAQQALKYILQTSSYNVRFCLICNYITKIDESLKNEFLCIRFNQLPRKDIFQFIRNICNKEEIELSDETLDIIQDMYQSDIRSMINFVQLEGTRIKELYLPFHQEVLVEIHQKIQSNISPHLFKIHLDEISIKYNMDKRTLLQKYFNYMIRTWSGDAVQLSEYLKKIEIIMHRPDIPMDILLDYLVVAVNE